MVSPVGEWALQKREIGITSLLCLGRNNLHLIEGPNVENHGGVKASFTTNLTDGLTTLGLNVLGVTLMITPLALWVAWNGTVMVIVLATGTMSGVLYCLLVLYEKPTDLAQGESATNGPLETVPDAFVEELHGLFPLTYHHRRLGDPKFQRKMDRLKSLLNS